MPDTLFTLPESQQKTLSSLRKAADRACTKLAKFTRQDPDKLWVDAALNRWPQDLWNCAEGEVFWETFMELNRAEVREIERRNGKISGAEK